MDENLKDTETTPEETVAEQSSPYVPRPMWQVWLARVTLVIFIVMILLYYINMMRGA